MNSVQSIVWKLVEILHSLFGYQSIYYLELIHISNKRKIYTLIVFIISIGFAIFLMINFKDFTTKSSLRFVFFFVVIEECSIAVISISTEISLIFSKNNKLFENIHKIDILMKLDREIKLKFKSKLTILYLFYFVLMAFTYYLDLMTRGFSLQIFSMYINIKPFDFMFLKFTMMIHLHLCRLCLMNDHLRKKLISKHDHQKSNWLFVWKLYPRNIEIRDQIKDLNVFMSVYSNLCESIGLVTKKFEFFVSKCNHINNTLD